MCPDYKQIYSDIINEKFPDKLSDPVIISKLNSLNTTVDILNFDKLIFGEAKYAVEFSNQRLRSYDKNSILEILEYQNKNKLTNIEVANHFKTSRNTISKWKNIFKI